MTLVLRERQETRYIVVVCRLLLLRKIANDVAARGIPLSLCIFRLGDGYYDEKWLTIT